MTIDQGLVIVRTFEAPRHLVWRSWTEPERVKRWWGPRGFTCPFASIDLRVGGKVLTCMRSPEGTDFWSTGVYREIDPPGTLVVTDSFADEEGHVVPASHYGLGDDFPLELVIALQLAERGDVTEMTLRHLGMPPGEALDLAMQGWNESFDKLAAALR